MFPVQRWAKETLGPCHVGHQPWGAHTMVASSKILKIHPRVESCRGDWSQLNKDDQDSTDHIESLMYKAVYPMNLWTRLSLQMMAVDSLLRDQRASHHAANHQGSSFTSLLFASAGKNGVKMDKPSWPQKVPATISAKMPLALVLWRACSTTSRLHVYLLCMDMWYMCVYIYIYMYIYIYIYIYIQECRKSISERP